MMPSIEERVGKLESIVFGAHPRSPAERDWQKSVGMLTDDDITKEIIKGALQLREQEREQARRESEQADT